MDTDKIVTGGCYDKITEFYEALLNYEVGTVTREGLHEHVGTQSGVNAVHMVPGTHEVADFLLSEFTITTREGFEAVRSDLVTSLLSMQCFR